MWISEAKLVEMAEDMKHDLVELPWKPRSGDARICPDCNTPMEMLQLAGADLDRCASHGIWFDDHTDELATVLEHAKKFPKPKIGKVPNVHQSLGDQLKGNADPESQRIANEILGVGGGDDDDDADD